MQVVAGRYQIVRKIGHGGMGTVYLAKQLGVGNQVALKFLPTHLSEDTQLRKRFEREAALSLEVTHPGAAQLLDMGTDEEGRLYMAFEYVEGEDLSSLLDREGALSYPEAIELTCKVAEALAYAHGRGVIHRDIKPENIRVRRDLAGLHVKVLDFGIARLMETVGTQLTMEGHAAGTPRYMAPEQIEAKPVDARADIYSLGLVLFESVTGREAFTRDSTSQLLWAQLHDAVPSLREVQPLRDFPELDAIIAKACAKSADERFASMQDMVRALKQLPHPQWGPAAPVTRRQRSPASATETLPSPPLVQRPGSGRTLWKMNTRSWLALGVGGVATVLAASALWMSTTRTPPATTVAAVPAAPASPPSPMAPVPPVAEPAKPVEPAPAAQPTAPTTAPIAPAKTGPATSTDKPPSTPVATATVPPTASATRPQELIITDSQESIDRCVQRHPRDADFCYDAIQAYAKLHPEQQFELGKRVRLNFMHWAAMPFFDAALAKNASRARCEDHDLGLAVVSGLSLPEGRTEKAMAERVFAGPCFAALRTPIEKELADSNANSAFGRSVCAITAKKKIALAGCEPATPPAATNSATTQDTLPPLDLAHAKFNNIKVFRGPEGERMTMAEVQGSTDVYVLRFDGIRGEWNGKTVVHQLETLSNRHTKLWTLQAGRRWYTLVSQGTRHSAYVPQAMDGTVFAYSEDDSKTASAAQLR
jgi:serine/threonine protein kinase